MSDPTTVESEIETAELSRIIEDFLETLTVQNRVVFMRRYWLSEICKEIAKRMGLIEKTQPFVNPDTSVINVHVWLYLT